MNKDIDLAKLAEPFPAADIEWRAARAGLNARGEVFCFVIAYLTARAIQQRLDDVCGPENWRVEEPRILSVKSAFAVGISIRIDGEWITKWDVAEPTNIEAAKGGFSGAMKRAGAQWGIGRYLYALDEKFAEISDDRKDGWNYAKLSEKHGNRIYYWKPPQLPAWALPKEKDQEVSADQLAELKRAWRGKFAPDSKNPKDLREGFSRFVISVCGEFPLEDASCWIREAFDKCMTRIEQTTDARNPDSDVPFDA